jgi:uncharacterized ubiquitin-like protein YukD
MKWDTTPNELTLKFEVRFLREYLISTGDLKVLTMKATKNIIIWVVTLCSLVEITDISKEHIAFIFRDKVSQASNQLVSWLLAWITLRPETRWQ